LDLMERGRAFERGGGALGEVRGKVRCRPDSIEGVVRVEQVVAAVGAFWQWRGGARNSIGDLGGGSPTLVEHPPERAASFDGRAKRHKRRSIILECCQLSELDLARFGWKKSQKKYERGGRMRETFPMYLVHISMSTEGYGG
jgi:hypothetical protein